LKNSNIIDVSKLKIYPCEGNVSTKKANTYGLKDDLLKNNKKTLIISLDVGLL